MSPRRSLALAASIKNWRYIAGTFQLRIPVSTPEVILWPEQNTLAILRWRLQHMASSYRYPVLKRYIEVIAGRVRGLGGNPTLIGPSLGGYTPPVQGTREPGEVAEFTGGGEGWKEALARLNYLSPVALIEQGDWCQAHHSRIVMTAAAYCSAIGPAPL
jgi:hypothetical protein